MTESILDELGREVTAILGPVTLCIALTVLIVRVLNPSGASSTSAVGLATVFYSESASDSTWEKLGGSLANALIFVLAVGLMTMVLVYAFKKGYTGWITGYMGFAAFGLFFFLNGFIVVALLQRFGVRWDWPSLLAMVFNSAVVGALTLFLFPAPLLVKQGYLIALAVGTAFVFTFVPEWSTWVLLIAMVVYDLVAVLAPWGPLKQLVELAEEMDEPIPALVYSARPLNNGQSAGSSRINNGEPSRGRSLHPETPVDSRPETGGMSGEYTRDVQLDLRSECDDPGPSSSRDPENPVRIDLEEGHVTSSPSSSRRSTPAGGSRTTTLKKQAEIPTQGADSSEAEDAMPQDKHFSSYLPRPRAMEEESESAALLNPINLEDAPQTAAEDSPIGDTDSTSYELPDAIRLGLGDFIFYSVMIGRASMHSALAAAACYVAVMAGLVCTLAWLAVSHHALPALPISIVLGVMVFLGSQLALEPVSLPLTLYGLAF